MLLITKLKNFFNEFHENINRSYEKPYYDNLIRQQRAPKEIENYFNSMELKIPELLQCLAELKIDKAKKIEQEIFTNIDNAINWYYKFYPTKTDDEKESLLTVEFKRNKTKKAIQELIKRIENKSTIEELFLNHFLDPNDKRLDIATILFDKYTKNFPQEVHNIFMWLWKDYSISIKSFNDLLDLKSSFKHYYKYIYIVYIQLLLHDLYLNKNAEIKPNLIKGGYNSYYNYNSIEFVPDTYYDVLKTELLYKYSTI